MDKSPMISDFTSDLLYNRACRLANIAGSVILAPSHVVSLENSPLIDEIYGCPISKWVAETWLEARVPGW